LSRVYLFTIQTSVGQTLSGGFRLHFNSYSTPFLSHDISARNLKAKMEGSLNPSSRLNNIDRSNTPAGIGLVEVTRERFGSSGGYKWNITFISAVGGIGKDSGRITVTTELESKGSSILIDTIQYGNSIAGTFALRFLSNETRQVSHDIQASELKDVLLEDFASVKSVDVIRNDAVANCNDGFCKNGPDQRGGYIWTLTITTDVGNQSPYSPTSNKFDVEGDLEEMTALNYLTY
jgi:hypothetical protein